MATSVTPTSVTPTITKKKSAVKVEMTVEAPIDAEQQFFRVDFGEYSLLLNDQK